jgi:hypothetical protein
LSNPKCGRSDCVNWKSKGECALSDPEKYNDTCLHFEGSIDSFKLRADSISGIHNKEPISNYKIIKSIAKDKQIKNSKKTV